MAQAYVSLQTLLGAPNLCGIIKLTVSGVPNPFPAQLYAVDKTCDGNTGTYTQYTGARELATLTNYGAPSSNRQLRELGIKNVTLFHSLNNIQLQPTQYMSLFQYADLAKQKMGEQEIARQVGELKWYQENLRIILMSAMLFSQTVAWDDKGNILPPGGSGNVANPFNWGVPSGNTGQLDIQGTGNPIFSVPWTNPLAKIPEQLSQLCKQSTQLTGYTIMDAYYGANVSQFMTANSYVQPYLARAMFPGAQQGETFVSDGQLPDKLFRLKWTDCSYSYWKDQNGNPQSFVGDDAVTFTPAPSNWWAASLEGTFPVPTKANVITSVETTFQSAGLEARAGMFAYGIGSEDPPGVKIVYGDTWLPVLKVPNAIFQSTVATGS